MKQLLVKLKHKIEYQLVKNRNDTFEFNGTTFKCLYHSYNATWLNERCMEVAIAKDILTKYADCKILEVGNVMSHYINPKDYSPFYHIVDKYEIAENVNNIDVLDFKTPMRFDLILSISTLEHVGKDSNNDVFSLLAVRHLLSLLKPDGRLIFTFPENYNEELENFVINKCPYIKTTVAPLGLLRKPKRTFYYVEIGKEYITLKDKMVSDILF